MKITIESKNNVNIKHLIRLARERKYREKTGEMVCEGEKMLFEALNSDFKVKTVLLKQDYEPEEYILDRLSECKAHIYSADKKLFELVSDVETPQNIIFSCEIPHKREKNIPNELNGALLLDGLQDPGNLGTILRTADAFALSAVILCEGCTDPSAPKVVRATMGAIFRQPIYQMRLEDAINELHKRKIKVYAAALDMDSISLKEKNLKNTAVIIGNEGRGVSQNALKLCDEKVIIPMAGKAESLNAGVAASIFMWEMCGGKSK